MIGTYIGTAKRVCITKNIVIRLVTTSGIPVMSREVVQRKEEMRDFRL